MADEMRLENMAGMKFTMTERRILTFLGECAHPVPVQRISEALRLPRAAERATGELWGRALLVRELVDEGGDLVSQVWALSPRGRQVVERGFEVHPGNRAIHVVRGTQSIKPSSSTASSLTDAVTPAAKDPADAWLAGLPEAPTDVEKPEIAPTLVWCYDGAQMVARTVARDEGIVTLQGVTVIRAGHLFDQADQRLPFLVLRENAVVGMGPLTES